MAKKILQYILFFSLFTPMFLDLRFYQPYVAGKYFYLAFLILLALPLVVYFLLQNKEIWRSSLARLLFLFFVGFSALNIFSADLLRTWWGDWQRMDGWLYFLIWFIFWLALIFSMTDKKSWLDFLRVSQMVLLVMLVFGLGQWLGWPGLADEQASRVYSLMGNANFFAHYLLLNFWLSIFSYYFDKKYRYIYIVLAILNILVIYQTGSRAAFLALAFTLLLFILFLLKNCWIKNKKAFWASVILFILFLSSSWFILDLRYKSYSLSDSTTEARLVAWQAGWQGFIDRPWLGWGRNNFYIPFNQYVDFRIYHDDNSPLWFDKAHNQFIDYLVEGGIIGFTLYLLMIFFPFVYLVRRRKEASLSLLWPLGLGLASNAIFLFFNFDTLISWLFYFIYLALLYFLVESKDQVVSKTSQSVKVFVIMFFSIIALFGIYFLVYKPILGNYYLKKIYLAPQRNFSWLEVEQSLHSVKKYSPQYQADLVFVLGGILDKVSWPSSQNVESLFILSQETKIAIQQHLLDAKIHYLFANVHLKIGRLTGSLDNLFQAKDYYEQVLPYLTHLDRPDIVYNLAQTYYELSFLDLEQKEHWLDKARVILEANAKRFPDNQDAQDKLQIFFGHQ